MILVWLFQNINSTKNYDKLRLVFKCGLNIRFHIVCLCTGKGSNDLTTNKSSLVDNSQPSFFFNYGVSNNHCNTTILFMFSLSCFYAYVNLFLCHHFLDFLAAMMRLPWHYQIICHYHNYIRLYHFHLGHWELHFWFEL